MRRKGKELMLTDVKYRPERKNIIQYPEYWLFIDHLATPTPKRKYKDQREIARSLSVHEVTLSRWKKVDGFLEDLVAMIRLKQIDNNLANVIQGMAVGAMQGFSQPAELWLAFVMKYERTQKFEHDVGNNLAEIIKASMDKQRKDAEVIDHEKNT